MRRRPFRPAHGNAVRQRVNPVAVTSSSGSRTGVATATSYLGLVAVGDSSVSAAKAQGGISTVSSVDVKRENILGVISKYTTTVKGN